jgi:hypothetical protein
MPRDPETQTWHEQRKNFRVDWNVPATIYDVDRHLERPCVLSDLSNGGAKLTGIRASTIPDEFRLRTPLGDRRACRVVWRTENALGVKFTDRGENDGGSHVDETREKTTSSRRGSQLATAGK